MEEIFENFQAIGQAVILSFLLFLFGRMLHALQSMRKLAVRTWQKAMTEFITALLGFIGIAAVIMVWTGV